MVLRPLTLFPSCYFTQESDHILQSHSPVFVCVCIPNLSVRFNLVGSSCPLLVCSFCKVGIAVVLGAALFLLCDIHGAIGENTLYEDEDGWGADACLTELRRKKLIQGHTSNHFRFEIVSF